MVTICLTAKLFKRTSFHREPYTSEPEAALGNWFADILFFRRRQILLFVSDNSRLAVITPAKEVRSMANHLTIHLSALLENLGAQPAWIDAEMRKMAGARFTTTNSRSVLGTMNDYRMQIEARVFEAEDVSPLELALALSMGPVGPLQYRHPGEVALDLLKKCYEKD
jgi:hypothetical protein